MNHVPRMSWRLRRSRRRGAPTAPNSPREISLGVAVPFLHLFGIVCGAWQWSIAATVSAKKIKEEKDETGYYAAQIALARFYMSHVLCNVDALAKTVAQGGPVVASFPDVGY